MQNMNFVLKEARFWRYVEKTIVTSLFLEAKKDDSEDWMEKIYAWEEKICKFQNNACKIIAKIKKIYIDTVQKEFLLVKALKDWTLKKLRNYLKTWYTLQNWASKWNIFGKLHKIWHGNCKNIQKLMTKIWDVKSKIEDLNNDMDEAITIQVLNFLDFSFSQFLGILSYDAIEKEQLPILESLAQSLKDEKLQMKNQDKARANYAKQFTKKKAKLPLSQLEDFQDLKPDLVTKCKFSKKKHKQNKY